MSDELVYSEPLETMGRIERSGLTRGAHCAYGGYTVSMECWVTPGTLQGRAMPAGAVTVQLWRDGVAQLVYAFQDGATFDRWLAGGGLLGMPVDYEGWQPGRWEPPPVAH